MIHIILSENVRLLLAAAGRGKEEVIGRYIFVLLIEAQRQAQEGNKSFMFCNQLIVIEQLRGEITLMTEAERIGIQHNIEIPCRIITLEKE